MFRLFLELTFLRFLQLLFSPQIKHSNPCRCVCFFPPWEGCFEKLNYKAHPDRSREHFFTSPPNRFASQEFARFPFLYPKNGGKPTNSSS